MRDGLRHLLWQPMGAMAKTLLILSVRHRASATEFHSAEDDAPSSQRCRQCLVGMTSSLAAPQGGHARYAAALHMSGTRWRLAVVRVPQPPAGPCQLPGLLRLPMALGKVTCAFLQAALYGVGGAAHTQMLWPGSWCMHAGDVLRATFRYCRDRLMLGQQTVSRCPLQLPHEPEPGTALPRELLAVGRHTNVATPPTFANANASAPMSSSEKRPGLLNAYRGVGPADGAQVCWPRRVNGKRPSVYHGE